MNQVQKSQRWVFDVKECSKQKFLEISSTNIFPIEAKKKKTKNENFQNRKKKSNKSQKNIKNFEIENLKKFQNRKKKTSSTFSKIESFQKCFSFSEGHVTKNDLRNLDNFLLK